MCDPALLLSKLLGMPGFICEECNTLLRVVATGGGSDTDGKGGVVMLMAFSVLIMINNCVISWFVDQVASTCLCSPISILWSLSMSIAIKSMTLWGEQGGLVGATNFL
jgi:hypothetical protein